MKKVVMTEYLSQDLNQKKIQVTRKGAKASDTFFQFFKKFSLLVLK